MVTIDALNFRVIPEEEARHLAEEWREDLHQFLTPIRSWIHHILPAKQTSVIKMNSLGNSTCTNPVFCLITDIRCQIIIFNTSPLLLMTQYWSLSQKPKNIAVHQIMNCTLLSSSFFPRYSAAQKLPLTVSQDASRFVTVYQNGVKEKKNTVKEVDILYRQMWITL